MANPLTLSQLKAGLAKWFPSGGSHKGYMFWPGAVGRPGTFGPINGFVIHHTGGAYTDSASYMNFLFITGRPAEGIPGQLCQFAIGGSGKLYIGNLGRANQAGSGDGETLSHVINEDYSGYSSELKPDSGEIDGNARYYGVEICYPGTLAMKPDQYKTAVRLAAMIVDIYGWSALSNVGHREHSNRKIDPGKITMYQFRKDVRALLAAGPGGTVAITATDVELIWRRPVLRSVAGVTKSIPAIQELADAKTIAMQNSAKLDAIANAIAADAANDITLEQIETLYEQELAQRAVVVTIDVPDATPPV